MDKSHWEPSTVTESTLSAVPLPTPVTVSTAEPDDIFPEVAVMVVVPAAADTACPMEPDALLMAATDGAEEVQVTDVVIS